MSDSNKLMDEASSYQQIIHVNQIKMQMMCGIISEDIHGNQRVFKINTPKLKGNRVVINEGLPPHRQGATNLNRNEN